MDIACKYVKNDHMKALVNQQINHVRSWKRVYLICELIGMNGKTRTIFYWNKKAKSPLKWWFMNANVAEPGRESFRV